MNDQEILEALLRHMLQPKWVDGDMTFSSEQYVMTWLNVAGYLTDAYIEYGLYQYDITEKGKEFLKFYGHGKAKGS